VLTIGLNAAGNARNPHLLSEGNERAFTRIPFLPRRVWRGTCQYRIPYHPKPCTDLISVSRLDTLTQEDRLQPELRNLSVALPTDSSLKLVRSLVAASNSSTLSQIFVICAPSLFCLFSQCQNFRTIATKMDLLSLSLFSRPYFWLSDIAW